ncbi:hypothetical protein PIB30_085812 [Stylosanthes scabra]|uniref:Uncharacterized protein n=1 Tax=Stylosanthes scabra TaxID=79078 RepID=A0ABU6ZRN1_9FABA|nr:hypothetical protein [Stylosanthes scabra]
MKELMLKKKTLKKGDTVVMCNTPKPINQVANMFDQFRSATDKNTQLLKSEHFTPEDLDSWRKLDARPSSRILRQPSKLEPVPKKSDNIRSENPQPMDSQYG